MRIKMYSLVNMYKKVNIPPVRIATSVHFLGGTPHWIFSEQIQLSNFGLRNVFDIDS